MYCRKKYTFVIFSTFGDPEMALVYPDSQLVMITMVFSTFQAPHVQFES